MSFFGPETPRPFSVITEEALAADRHLQMQTLVDENSVYSRDYDASVCDLINEYLDIDCSDEVLLVKSANFERDSKYREAVKNWPRVLAKKFCLTKSVHICFLVDSNEYEFHEMDKDFNLTKISCKKCNYKKFDKIIIKNCLKYFESNFNFFREFFKNFIKNPLQCKDCVLIMQRVADLNTLPFYDKIVGDWQLNDTKYTKFIEKMQKDYFTLKWNIEILKYNVRSKFDWFKYLQQKFPYP
jgi:hypothetical protein